MGSKKIYLVQSLKRVATLASVLGVISGMSVGFASAQTAHYQPLNQKVQAALDAPALRGSAIKLPAPTYAPVPAQNSARILRAQPTSIPRAAQQATANRRALVRQGRMISAGYRQEDGVLGTLPQKPDQSILQQDDDDQQDFFGGDQTVPTTPRNDVPQIPVPQDSDTQKRQDGELPPDIFANPFKDEKRTKPDNPIEIPNDTFPVPPDDPGNGEETPEAPKSQQNQNPFVPESNSDNQINYQPGRGFGAPQGQSNVYRAPGSDDALESGKGVYFVPAYDPIPGTHQPTLAPPATINSYPGLQQQPAWPGQYAGPSQYPQYPHPQYQYPPYQQPPYPQQYPQPPYPQQYQQPPAHTAYPPGYPPAPAVHPEQQVYTPVVQPPTNMACGNGAQGPMSTARLGLLGKLKQEWKKDWGFGDYQSCQTAGNCGGCNTGCGSCSTGCGGVATCPVFYFGFQGAWNDAFDVTNGQGSELVLDDGTAFFFSLGRMNGRNLRTEIELSFRDNDISSLLTDNGELPLTGQLQTFSGMANAYWEFVKSPTGRLKPYVGVGVGFLSATTDIRLASDPSTALSQDDSSSSFAYQWMAGVNFKVSNHLDLYGEYRFVDADSFGIPSDRDDLFGDFGYSANSVGGGFRWKF